MLREPPDRVGIIGLGLMGGSLARDLAGHGAHVLAFDRDRAVLEAAHHAGIVQTVLDESLGGIENANTIVLAVPVSAAAGVLGALASRLAADGARLITDVGSTKRSVVAAAESLGMGRQFVGSHPMAGDHRSGWMAARNGLYDNARVYLCPAPSTTDASLHAAQSFWNALGALPRMIDAAAHDRLVAFTSHLPHVVSTVVAQTLEQTGVRRADLGPGGRDVTRLAGGSPDAWTAIAADNADHLDEALAGFEVRISALRRALNPLNEAALRRIFVAGNAWFEAPNEQPEQAPQA
ncbi:MAG TPA: prephenate dehydrogenase/arogenate dehydrogenase family protein [Gemmatimonadaceae bacterium]|nr:prephenate dehydrogenase/arogenate dehydrogenase family protein [Gemmatimonadaceae bacterium]